MDETLILVNEKDKFLGYASREECHSGEGKRHRAFATLLMDNDGNVLLQKRKHKLFNNLWDLTAISHPLYFKNRDETLQEASDRALAKEMGIGHVEVENLGAFNYFAMHDDNCENENCAVLVGTYDGDYKANPEEVYEVKKIPFDTFVADVRASPKIYTPWAVLAIDILQKHFLK